MDQRSRTSSRFVRRLCSIMLFALAAAVAVQDVSAGQPRGRRAGGFRNGAGEARAVQMQRAQQRPQRNAPRDPIPQRAAERETSQPIAPPVFQPADVPGPDRNSRGGRMTPDERRALRQQINEAGRNVYRPNVP